MNLYEFLPTRRIKVGEPITSRDEILRTLAHLLTDGDQDTSDKVFEALLKRENIGSTAIGSGVAIPHSRLDFIGKPTAALLTLQSPIIVNKADDTGTDIFLAIIVPSDPGDFSCISSAARSIRNDDLLDDLRHARTATQARAALRLEDDY